MKLDMLFNVLLVICVIVFGLIVNYDFKNTITNIIFFWFYMSFALYNLMPFIEFHFLQSFINFSLSGVKIDYNKNSEINSLITFLITSVLLIVFFSRFPITKIVQFDKKIDTRKLFLFLISTYLLIFIIFFPNFVASFGSYEGNVTTKGVSGVFSFFCDFISFSAGIFAFVFYANKLFVKSLLFSIIPIIMGVLLSSKDEIIIGLISIVNIYFFLHNKKGKVFLSFAVLFLAPLFSVVFSVYRTPEASIVDLNSYIFYILGGIYLNSDVGGNFVVYRILTDSVDYFQLGIGHLEGLMTFLPNFLFNRGLDPAENLASSNMINYERGMGIGYSFLGEAYSNFGYFSVFSYILYFSILFFCFKYIKKLFRMNDIIYLGFLSSFVSYSLVSMHRSFLFGSLKNQIYFMLFLCFFSFCYSRLTSIKY